MSQRLFNVGDIVTDGSFHYEIEASTYLNLLRGEYPVKFLDGMLKGTTTYIEYSKLKYVGKVYMTPVPYYAYPAPGDGYEREFLAPVEPVIKQCECGKEKHNFFLHSRWCPKYE